MKTQVIRFDKDELESAEHTPQGFFRVPVYDIHSVYSTHTDVLICKIGDRKVIRESRPPEKVFKTNSLYCLSKEEKETDASRARMKMRKDSEDKWNETSCFGLGLRNRISKEK